jgi:hypothetical protein
MVEFAIILPLLMLLMIGIMDFGRYFLSTGSMNTAVRESARFGSIVGLDEGNPNFENCAGIIAAGAGFADPSLSDDAYTIEYFQDDALATPVADCDDSDLTYPNPSAIDFNAGDRIRVSASQGFDLLAPFISAANPLTIQSSDTRSFLSAP